MMRRIISDTKWLKFLQAKRLKFLQAKRREEFPAGEKTRATNGPWGFSS